MSETESSEEEKKAKAAAAIGKAVIEASADGAKKPEAEPTNPAPTKEPSVQREEVLYAAASAPESTRPAVVENDFAWENSLAEAAIKVGAKSFKELSIDKKVDILRAHAKDLGSEGAVILEKLQNIQSVLRSTPIEEQWEKIEPILATMPEDFRTSEDRSLRVLRYELYTHVSSREALVARGFKFDEKGKVVDKTVEWERKRMKDSIGYKAFWEKYGMTEPEIIEGAAYTPFKLDIKKDLPFVNNVTNKNLRRTLGIYQLQLNGAHSEEETFAILQEMSKQLREGVVAKMDPKTLTLEKPLYNRREAEIFRAKIDAEIYRIEEAQREAMRKPSSDHLKSTTAMGLQDELKSMYGYLDPTDYERIGDYVKTKFSTKEKNEFLTTLEYKINKIVERLEQNKNEPWRIGGIETYPRELQEELLIVAEIDPHLYDRLLEQTQARSWLHQIAHAIRTGSSPQDTKEVLAGMQQLDEMGYYTRIAELSGTNAMWKLLESHADELMASEVRPDGRKAILTKIIDKFKKDKSNRDLLKDMDARGVTPEAAFNVAERFWITTGREAAKYKEYAETHKLYWFEKRKDAGGKEHIVVQTDPSAEWKLDSMRLAMMFPVLVAEFHMGSTTKGSLHTFKVNGVEFKNVVSGQGVGADVFSKMMENGLDLNIQDWWSRRFEGYILPAWIDQQLDPTIKDAKGNLISASWSAEQKQDAKTWKERAGNIVPNVASGNVISGDSTQNMDVRLLFLKKDLVKAKYGIKFSEHFGTQVKGFSGEWDENVQTLKRDARRNAGMIAQIEQLDTQYKALNNRKKTRDIEMMKLYRPKDINGHAYTDTELEGMLKRYGTYIPTMEGYNINEIPFERTARLQENVRGNLRDTIAELGVVNKVIDFINNPTIEHLMAFDKVDMTVYTFPDAFEIGLMIPAYLAFCDVQRGKGPLGYDFGLVEWFRSKYGRVYDTASLSDLDLYKIGRSLIGKGSLSRDQLYRIRGSYKGLLRDKALQYYDPISLFILMAAVAQHESQEMQKEASKG